MSGPRIGVALHSPHEPVPPGSDFVEIPLEAPSRTPEVEYLRLGSDSALPLERVGETPIVVPGSIGLKAIVRLAASGQRVLVANVGADPTRWSEVMRGLPGEVGFALDLGHAHADAATPPAVDEPALAFLRWADRVELIRLHDSQRLDEGGRCNLPLGWGTLRLPTLAAALRDAGVRVPIVLDLREGSRSDLIQSLALARDVFSAFW